MRERLASFRRQLKWRIIAAHMVVVIVGVTFVLAMSWFLTVVFVPTAVSGELAALSEEQAASVISTFRTSIITAVIVAGFAAVIAGIITSLLLAREILRPLNQMTTSSQRIARGHYAERVAEPSSNELAKVAANFNEMAAALEKVEQQRIALIGNVSHELRTPLAGLNGYLEGLMDGVFPPNEETFALMDTEIRRLRRLVNDLQALSRVEAGQISLTMSSFDLQPLVERVLAQLQPQAEAQSLLLEMEAPETAVTVYADSDRTAQVLLNLVGNAIRYTPENGRVQVRVEAQNGKAFIHVVDTGVGIPSEALPYIFERFYRVDPSRTRNSGGSGIGLTISRHLVWAMGGDISATSEGPGKGSTFSFSLPLATSHSLNKTQLGRFPSFSE